MPPIWFMSSFGFKTQDALGSAVKCWSPNFTCRELFWGNNIWQLYGPHNTVQQCKDKTAFMHRSPSKALCVTKTFVITESWVQIIYFQDARCVTPLNISILRPSDLLSHVIYANAQLSTKLHHFQGKGIGSIQSDTDTLYIQDL